MNFFGKARHGEDLVAIDDGAAVDGNLGIGSGLGAGGDDDEVSAQVREAGAVADANVVGVDELAGAVEKIDAVALELVLNHSDFVFDDALHSEVEVGHGDDFLGALIGAVKFFVIETREMQDGFAHGLAGDRAGIGADATDAVAFR